MNEEKGKILYDESNLNENTYGFIPAGLLSSLGGFILGYMAIMSSAVLLGLGFILVGFIGIVTLVWARKWTAAQVYEKGIIFPSAPFRDIIHKGDFIPYSHIIAIIWVKSGSIGHIEVIFRNKKIRIEHTIRDFQRFLDACSPFVKTAREKHIKYDKEKYLADES